MAAGIPVNDQGNGWLKHFLRIVGILGLMGGIALAAFVPDGGSPGIIVGGVAVFLLVVNEVQIARQKAAERSVVDTGSGFRWLGGPTDIEVQDSQAVAVRIKRTPKFSAGILKGIVRRFEVWTADGDNPMCMTNRLAVNGDDPLAALIIRVTEDLKQRTARSLASGATLEGGGWSLAAAQLSVVRGKTVETLPFVEIDKVGDYDGKICLWRQGRDEPAMKISPDSKNAPVLAALLNEWVDHQCGASRNQPEPSPGASGMGRLLFERRRNEGFWLGIVVAGIGGAAGAAMLFDRNMMSLGVVLLVVAAVSLPLTVLFGRYLFRCYELGLTSARGHDKRRLLYDEITEFTYGAKRTFDKVGYAGTQVRLLLRAPSATILYSAKVQNMDADLDELRDRIARIIAIRMLSALRAGRTVPWTDDVVFLPRGLQFRRSKLLGLASGPVEILPYEQIRNVDLNEGVLHLYSKAEAKPVINKPSNTLNFFPGYFLVLSLQEPGLEHS